MRSLLRTFYAVGLGLALSSSYSWAEDEVVPAGGGLFHRLCPPSNYVCPPVCPPPPLSVTPMPAPGTPTSPGQAPAMEPVLSPERSLALDTSTFATATPNMIGDFSGRYVMSVVTKHVQVKLSSPQLPNLAFFAPADFSAKIRVPVDSAAAFKIAENESPRPQDRFFATYNYFDHIFSGASPAFSLPNDAAPTVTSLTNFGIPFASNPAVLGPNGTLIFQTIKQFAAKQPGLYDQYLQTVIKNGNVVNFVNAPPAVQALANQIKNAFPSIPAAGIPIPTGAFQIASGEAFVGTTLTNVALGSANLHQEVFGIEKTFLDGDASIGLRIPIVQIEGDSSLSSSDFGDLSIILKYALINDTKTGDVLSGGLVVTVPTGRDITLINGSTLHPTLLQPFVGGIYNIDRFYVHGFSSLAVPTDVRDALLLFNDVGVGYTVYRNDPDAFLSRVTPTFEVHVNTPLNHRGSQGQFVAALDEIVLTSGLHLEFLGRLQLTGGVATPVTGPRPFAIEGFAHLNFRF